MNFMLLLLAAIAVLLPVVEPADGRSDPLRIGAFNIQVFGRSKISKDFVIDILVKVHISFTFLFKKRLIYSLTQGLFSAF